VTTRASDENTHGDLLMTETAMDVTRDCSICNRDDSH
jgi:hypothetical protein